MRRLNVRFAQIEECIEKSLFAVDSLPRTPELQPGELLLLQLVKADAERLNKSHARIEFALIFDHVMPDPDGSISRLHWPNAGKTWKHILVCRDTVPSMPFSLEDLALSQYGGQSQCIHIQREDEKTIRQHFIADFGDSMSRAAENPRALLDAIRNHDVVVRIKTRKPSVVSEHLRRHADPWLGNVLKMLYGHRCQVCAHDFEPRYGVTHANTRLITDIARGGSLESRNRLVVCPNHDSIIEAARAHFNEVALAFEYPNGLVESLMLRDHLIA